MAAGTNESPALTNPRQDESLAQDDLMTRFRLILLTLLFLAPFVVLIGLGGLPPLEAELLVGLVAAAGVHGRWRTSSPGAGRARRGMLPPTEIPPPEYWTDRDKVAWEKVDAKAKSFEKVTLDQISNPKHYTDLALDLATEVGQIYNPGADDPFDHLTLPEVLACVELAAADLDGMVQKYVPGVHLIRLRDIKRAKKAYDWYKTGQNVYWAGAAVFDPISGGPALPRVAERRSAGS